MARRDDRNLTELEVNHFLQVRTLYNWLKRQQEHTVHVCLYDRFVVILEDLDVANDGNGEYNFIPRGDASVRYWGLADDEESIDYMTLRATIDQTIVFAPVHADTLYVSYSKDQLEQSVEQFKQEDVPLKRIRRVERGNEGHTLCENIDAPIGITIWVSLSPISIRVKRMQRNFLELYDAIQAGQLVLPFPQNTEPDNDHVFQKIYV